MLDLLASLGMPVLAFSVEFRVTPTPIQQPQTVRRQEETPPPPSQVATQQGEQLISTARDFIDTIRADTGGLSSEDAVKLQTIKQKAASEGILNQDDVSALRGIVEKLRTNLSGELRGAQASDVAKVLETDRFFSFSGRASLSELKEKQTELTKALQTATPVEAEVIKAKLEAIDGRMIEKFSNPEKMQKYLGKDGMGPVNDLLARPADSIPKSVLDGLKPEQKVVMAKSPDASPELLAKLATDPVVQPFVAANPHTPEGTLLAMCTSTHAETLRAIADNPNAGQKVWEKLPLLVDPHVDAQIAANVRIGGTQETRANEFFTRIGFANGDTLKKLDPDLIRSQLDQLSVETRMALAKNLDVQPWFQDMLSFDSDKGVREAAVKSGGDHLQRMIGARGDLEDIASQLRPVSSLDQSLIAAGLLTAPEPPDLDEVCDRLKDIHKQLAQANHDWNDRWAGAGGPGNVPFAPDEERVAELLTQTMTMAGKSPEEIAAAIKESKEAAEAAIKRGWSGASSGW